MHSLWLGEMRPIKIDNMDIQTEVSSQFSFDPVNSTMQIDISSNISNICTKKYKI